MDSLVKQQVIILQKDVQELQKALGTTQKELSQVLQEMQLTIQGLARAMNMTTAIVNERLNTIEGKAHAGRDMDIPESGREL